MTISKVEIPRPEGHRHYLLAQPKAAAGKHPLVILLHGHAGSAKQLLGLEHSAAPLSIWLKIADRDGLLIAAPDGFRGADGHQGWNDCRADAKNNPQVDDVGFIAAIIKKEISEHNADPQRIFVMGMSNGGMMTFRIASELGDKIAAFAAVSASMAARTSCLPPEAPVSALIISGTKDPLVPYTGGKVHFITRTSRGAVIGVEDSADIWRKLDNLPATPVMHQYIRHRMPNDKTELLKTLWGKQPDGLQVELIRVEKGGHVEPSITQRYHRFYNVLVGAQNADIETAEEAWAFFKNKRLR